MKFLFLIRIISFITHAEEVLLFLCVCAAWGTTDRLYSTQRILEFKGWDMN